MLSKSRFNPKPGILDFWNEFRKPNPLRGPILLISMAPFAVIFYWLSGETVYKTPDRPRITYITTLDENRSDEEIIASNIANQEVRDLREEQQAALDARKRELYRALGEAAGMDVEEIERRADANRAAEEAEEQARREDVLAGAQSADQTGEPLSQEPVESQNP